jgi:large subunit ribosomal protein L25
MEHQVVEVTTREGAGKGAARKLRAKGHIPGVLYGHKEAPQPLALDPIKLKRSLRDSGMGANTLLRIQGLSREVLALIKDTQVDPVKRNLLHVDLIEVRETETVTVLVPLEFTGKPAGVTAGGELGIARRSLAVKCSPVSIPKLITLDVSHLQLGQTMHVSDVNFPEGTTSGFDGRLAIASVRAPRAEKVETAAEATPAEGAAAAPAEGAAAAPAAAAKAPAKAPAKK